MNSTVRTRFWIETTLASAGGFLAILTLWQRDWIEGTTGAGLDQHDGSLEWLIVTGLFALCALGSGAAYAEWRRPRQRWSSQS